MPTEFSEDTPDSAQTRQRAGAAIVPAWNESEACYGVVGRGARRRPARRLRGATVPGPIGRSAYPRRSTTGARWPPCCDPPSRQRRAPPTPHHE